MKWLMFSIVMLCSCITAHGEECIDLMTDTIKNVITVERADSVIEVDSLPGGDGVMVEHRDGKVVIVVPQDSRYNKLMLRRHKFWNSLIPTHFIIQNAGNMGLFSAGAGWSYGKRRKLESSLLFGFLPKHKSKRAKLTVTLKGTYLPWQIDCGKGWMFEPLSCGLYINTVFGDEFWGRQPDRYPEKYYPLLKTNLRINVFIGERITFKIPENKRKLIKSISAFYEVSTCDLYVRSIFIDKNVSLWDILGLSLGIKLQIQ